MASSKDMARLSKVEKDVGEMKVALIQLTHTAVEQSQRLDTVTERLDTVTERLDTVTERLDKLTDRVDVVTDRLDRLTDRVDTGFRAMTDRLDRLIAVTIDERTRSYDRMHDFEKRLERLEERVGIT